MFGLTTTRRLRAELAAAKAETNRQRERAEKAIKAKETAETNRTQVLRQNADLDEKYADVAIVNELLTENLRKARWQRVIARKAAARILAAYTAEKQRADRLQKQMDTFLGLDVAAVVEGATWQDRREQRMKFDKPSGEGVAS